MMSSFSADLLLVKRLWMRTVKKIKPANIDHFIKGVQPSRSFSHLILSRSFNTHITINHTVF